MRKLKNFFLLVLMTPVMVGNPVVPEKPDLQASPSGLVEHEWDWDLKAEGYVEHVFEYNLEAGEKVLDPSINSPANPKSVRLIPAPPEEGGNGVSTGQAEQGVSVPPAVATPSEVEIKIDGPSVIVRLFDADGIEDSAEQSEVEFAKVVKFLNEWCDFSGPESSEYDLSPKFSVGDDGKLVAKTGEYLTYIDTPIVTKITLRDLLDEGIVKNSATMRNSEGKLLILPYQAIELAQRGDSLIRNITETILTTYGSNLSIYNIKSFERLEFLGLVTFETEIETAIDAVTGETLKQPWFSKLPFWMIKNIS